MAESTLSLSYTDLIAAIGGYLGYGVTSGDWSAAQSAEIDVYLQGGIRQFYYPPAVDGVEAAYEWSFLKPTTTLTTTADDAAQVLPDTCGRVLTDFFFAAETYSRSIVQISEARLLSFLQQTEDTGRPRYFAVRHLDSDQTDGQRLEVAFWPIPDDAYVLTYQYEAYSGSITSLRDYPLGGMKYSELIVESCLAVAELRANDEKGIHWESFVRLLKSGVAQDRKFGARYFGPMGGPGEDTVSRHMVAGSSYDVEYKGTTY